MPISNGADIEEEKSDEKSVSEVNGIRKASKIRQWLFTLSANLTVLSTGMVLGFPAVSLSQLTAEDNAVRLDEDQGSWFASVNEVICPLGGLLASFILDRIGRKLTMNLIGVITVISWTLVALTPDYNPQRLYYQLLAGRMLTGFAGGLSGSPSTVYAAEIAHPSIRGRLTVMTSVAIASGVLLIYFLGFLFQDNWRLIAMISAGICLVAFLVSLYLPESPRWLAMRNRIDQAEHSYHKLNGKGSNDQERSAIAKEINQLVQECQKQPSGDAEIVDDPLWAKLKRPNFYKPMGFLIGFFTIQQLCGIFVIIVYIDQLATSVGVTLNVYIFTVITGLTRIIGVIISGFGSDQIGRRRLAFTSGIGISLSTFAIVLIILFPFKGSHWLGMLMILLYVFLGTLGYQTLPFALMAELFPADIRGFATGFNIFYVNLIAFVMIKSYPYVEEAVGVEYIFAFISCCSMIGVAFLDRFMPETKGITMKELEELYK